MPAPITDSLPFSASGTVSWIHLGDLHMTRPGEQNEIDLGRIVDEINAVYARGGIDFVYLPGDIADDGSVVAYEAVRRHLDRLKIPWCGIVGDHDVHEKSFDNFRRYISEELYGRFSIGPYCFLRLNAFSSPRPDAFTLSEEQLRWLEEELRQCDEAGERAILLLHCYPSDLKQGGEELKRILQRYPVLLVDMGHTHYNELSNDGRVLYSATRSTGQIEEGPVGYSVTTIDKDAVSWHFVELGSRGLVAITQPQDDRLMTQRSATSKRPDEVLVSVKTWSDADVRDVVVQTNNVRTSLSSTDGLLWRGKLDTHHLIDGTHELIATATTITNKEISSSLQLRIGPHPDRTFSDVDYENAIGEWCDRGLLGTQLGPNKNGKKW
ncbi:metallophosphoesterase family protein [Terriglobus roseus]|uniref:Calcineurin-like phosphoesterase n=1 Tax=Terriglobus roseus TaxID=392734 RepID=A0A1H4LGI3_9BACT|nr:metallophosphoesterase [Terriglobus roseus]SEB69810.1 Calcineurin-like phosphoesterase [Terriglobus roseus]